MKRKKKKNIRKSRYKLRVGRGSAGLALFTEEPIKKGKFVIEYYGPLLTDEEADEKGGKYLFEINKKWTVDGTPRYNTARYMNHSCRPNCVAEIDGRRIYLFSKRYIHPSEELTYHYGKGYWEDWIDAEGGCKCEKCEGK